MTVIATETLIEIVERGAQLRHRGARQSVIFGTLETSETSHHVISMLAAPVGTHEMGRLQRGPLTQILPTLAPGLRIVAAELGEDEVAETLADVADHSIMMIETDTMIPGIAHWTARTDHAVGRPYGAIETCGTNENSIGEIAMSAGSPENTTPT